jgi:2-dehydro-3-deoxyphosphogluconate aldolase / (4S)-4-hydroxy-2-oxoglutarate aldolase
MREDTLQKIASARLIAILRGDFGNAVDTIADQLVLAGVTVLEVTMNSPGALEHIERLARRLRGRAAVGVGTVRNATEVRRAADAGATFVVSAECLIDVIKATRDRGLVSLPGCFTPTEVAVALDAGADAVKLFPAVSLGVGFLRALRGPRSDLRTVPTGGITLENAAEWLDAGAWALGVGGELIGRDADRAGIRERAEAFVRVCRGNGA